METTIKLSSIKNYYSPGYGLFGFLLLLWLVMPGVIKVFDRNSGAIDPAIWLLILLSLLAFLMFAALSWWLLKKIWFHLGLPQLYLMVLHFKNLELWQQLGFYWASFALLLLAGVLCLNAIC